VVQAGPTQRILQAAKAEDCNPNWIPASPEPLGSDPDVRRCLKRGLILPLWACCCACRPTRARTLPSQCPKWLDSLQTPSRAMQLQPR
jgi:hypothetical protein